MKLIFTLTIIALSTTALLAQDKKATQPAQKNQKQVKHKPDSTKTKKATDPEGVPKEDQNPEMLRNTKMKPNTDLINVPGK
jgi:hypothetical protein